MKPTVCCQVWISVSGHFDPWRILDGCEDVVDPPTQRRIKTVLFDPTWAPRHIITPVNEEYPT